MFGRMIGIVAVAGVCLGAWGQDGPAVARTTRVGLFKNGIALIEKRIELKANQSYYLAPAPEPLHGTMWVMSDAQVGVRRSTRTLELSREDAAEPLYGPLIGKDVSIRLSENDVVDGRIEALIPVGREPGWGRDYASDPYGRWPYPWMGYEQATPRQGRMLAVRTEHTRLYLRPETIVTIEEKNPAALEEGKVEEEVPVLEFSASGVPAGGGSATVLYLTKGMTWAPSYRVRLGADKAFTLEQQALLINEREDLESVPVELITGYPAIAYVNTTSPLAPRTTLQQFFREVAEQARTRMGDRNDPAAITNQAVFYAGGGGGGFGGEGESPATPPDALTAGDADVHYLPLGDVTLREGEVLSMPLGEGEGTYKNVLLWTEQSHRDRQGEWPRFGSDADPRLYYPGLWDAVVMTNPLDRPLTTAPCSFELDGRFLGETVLYWTAAGKETTLPLTKALGLPVTVREEYVETRSIALPNAPGAFQQGPQVYRVTMTLTNSRPEAQEVSIQYRLMGAVVKLEEGSEAEAHVVRPQYRNDEYLVSGTMRVEADSDGMFAFTYERWE